MLQHFGLSKSATPDVDVAGSALTTFNKGAESLAPKVIALRSLQYTSGEMLYNPEAYAEFKAKVKINVEVLAKSGQLLEAPAAVHSCSWFLGCSLSYCFQQKCSLGLVCLMCSDRIEVPCGIGQTMQRCVQYVNPAQEVAHAPHTELLS